LGGAKDHNSNNSWRHHQELAIQFLQMKLQLVEPQLAYGMNKFTKKSAKICEKSAILGKCTMLSMRKFLVPKTTITYVIALFSIFRPLCVCNIDDFLSLDFYIVLKTVFKEKYLTMKIM